MTADGLIEAMKAATERAFAHRKLHLNLNVRVGFWPDGLVIRAIISAIEDADLEKRPPQVRVIAWADIATSSSKKAPRVVGRMSAPFEPPAAA